MQKHLDRPGIPSLDSPRHEKLHTPNRANHPLRLRHRRCLLHRKSGVRHLITQPTNQPNKTMTTNTTLTELQRPQFDRTTGGPFKGNHYDLIVTRFRAGDTITEHTAAIRNSAGMLSSHSSHTYSASEMVRMAEEYGLTVTDDIPQGSSLVS